MSGVNLFKPSPKQWILILVIVYLGVTVFINLSRKKTDEPVKNVSPIKKTEVPDAKPVNQEYLDKLKQLKVLESKLQATRKKHTEALRLRDVIEAQLKLRINLLVSSQSRINHLVELLNEGALNDQDLELAKAQFKTIELSIEKARSDSVKINKYIDEHAKTLAKEEADLNQLKSQVNLETKN